MPLKGLVCCKTGLPTDFDHCIHQSLYTDTCQHMPALVIAMSRNKDDRKDAGKLSATEMLSCARFNILKNEYDYYENPSDYFDRFRGHISHSVVEGYVSQMPGTIVERRVEATVNGVRFTGKMDLVVPSWEGGDGGKGIIIDLKSTKKRVTSIKEPQPNHITQVNIYSYLLRHGYFIDTGEKVDVECTHGEIVYIEMGGYKSFLFPLMWPQDQDELVESLIAENSGWSFPTDLPHVLPSNQYGRHWMCKRCPVREQCDKLAGIHGDGVVGIDSFDMEGNWDV